MVENWSVFRKMWREYYLRWAGQLSTSEVGAEEGGEPRTVYASEAATEEVCEGSAADEEVDEGLGLWQSDWLKYVGKCQENGNQVFLPHLRLFDGGTWHHGQGECSDTDKCQDLCILTLEASYKGPNMFQET